MSIQNYTVSMDVTDAPMEERGGTTEIYRLQVVVVACDRDTAIARAASDVSLRMGVRVDVVTVDDVDDV